jgi:hypothetical protein
MGRRAETLDSDRFGVLDLTKASISNHTGAQQWSGRGIGVDIRNPESNRASAFKYSA